jgi:hypothetical protein
LLHPSEKRPTRASPVIRNHFHFDLHHPRKGETIFSIARDFGIPVGVLVHVNGFDRNHHVPLTAPIKIPFWEELFKGKSYRKDLPTLMWPVLGGTITSPFGLRWGRPHRGIDIRASIGEPVFAAHSGIVDFAGMEGGFGKVVKLRAGDITTYYAHLSRLEVLQGWQVVQGDLIGLAGNTGDVSGPHCHFETRIKNSKGNFRAIDPENFFISW